jgi:ribulose-phosphate 3-epimerase
MTHARQSRQGAAAADSHARALTAPVAAPSILSADFTRLPEALALIDPERDWVHCDIMDWQFVPNLTFGPLVVGAVRRLTSAFIDAHLMVVQPERMVRAFRDAGADQITVHLEACPDPGVVLDQIRASGARAGLSIKPKTPFSATERWLDRIDLLLVMTVEPGFGGQSFMADMLPKVEAARLHRERADLRYRIEVDGGIAPDTAKLCRRAGADVFVAGHAIYGAASPEQALTELRAAIATSD